MRRGYLVALMIAGCLAVPPRFSAQAPAGGNGAGTVAGQSTPADAGQKPPAAPPQSESNPFPEDTSKVPVLPSKIGPALPQGSYSGSDYGSGTGSVPLAGDDQDPVRSPDDPAPEAGSGEDQGWSSSLTGLDKLLPKADDDQPGKRKRKEQEIAPEHKETSKEDIDVGNYYLDNKNWRAALSRFESAMVLDPENPEVYWGMAEAERHLGDFLDAKTYYQKVAEYDPDSRHGKESIKALKEPEIANAKKPAGGQPGAGAVK
jgi:hypothetical protein